MSWRVSASFVLVGLLAVASCAQEPAPGAASAPAQPMVDAADDIAAIKTARDAFMAAYEQGDAEAIGRLYTEDAISEPNHQPTLAGREAIVNSLRTLFEQVEVKPVLTPDETKTLGNVGLDRGHYTVTVTPKAGASPTTAEGRYLVIFRKGEDGQWRVWRDMDNGRMPPAAADTTASEPTSK